MDRLGISSEHSVYTTVIRERGMGGMHGFRRALSDWPNLVVRDTWGVISKARGMLGARMCHFFASFKL